MKKVLFAIFIALIISVYSHAQSGSETKYYENKSLSKEVKKAKATYSRTVFTNPDGSSTTEIKRLRDDTVVKSETYKGEEPFGIWKYEDDRTGDIKELNYEFDLDYKNTACKYEADGQDDVYPLNDNPGRNIISPKIASGESDINSYLSKNIKYPEKAIDNGIQGKVFLRMMVNKEGVIEKIAVVKGSNPLLDKEAVRVMRQLRFTNALTVNKEPRDFCILVPVTFRLE